MVKQGEGRREETESRETGEEGPGAGRGCEPQELCHTQKLEERQEGGSAVVEGGGINSQARQREQVRSKNTTKKKDKKAVLGKNKKEESAKTHTQTRKSTDTANGRKMKQTTPFLLNPSNTGTPGCFPFSFFCLCDFFCLLVFSVSFYHEQRGKYAGALRIQNKQKRKT